MVALKDKLDLNDCRLMVVYQCESEELDHKLPCEEIRPRAIEPQIEDSIPNWNWH